MPSINISGFVVDFPFEPYDCQTRYMESVIKALVQRSNALLESPTGTGKTLCLLCATLAWRKAYEEALVMAEKSPNSPGTKELAAKVGLDLSGPKPVVNIIGNVNAGRSMNQARYATQNEYPTVSDMIKASSINLVDNVYSNHNLGTLPMHQPTPVQHALHNTSPSQANDTLFINTSSDGNAAFTDSNPLESTMLGDISTAILNPVTKAQSLGGYKLPRIVYASRTHSQLAKVISELRSTAYGPRMAVLGSREQMCIHDKVSKLKGPRQRQACLALTKNRQCKYKQATDNRKESLVGMVHSKPLDIEDLIQLSLREAACPFYLSRYSEAQSELLILPYNYLIDKNIRNTFEIDWNNDVIILDEAHNLDSVCSEAVSFDITSLLLNSCIRELEKARELASSSSAKEDAASAEDCQEIMSQIARLKNELETEFVPDNSYAVHNGGYILEIFQRAGMNSDNVGKLKSSLSSVMKLLTGSGKDDRFGAKKNETNANGKADFSGPSAIVSSVSLDYFFFALSIAFRENMSLKDLNTHFRVCVHIENPDGSFYRKSEAGNNSGFQPATMGNRNGSLGSGSHMNSSNKDSSVKQRRQLHGNAGFYGNGTPRKVLSLWCQTSGLAMEDISSLGIRSVLLTSGTLSPLDALASELRIPFPVRLENPHVITKKQVWGAVVPRGPSGFVLNSSFKSRNSDDYNLDLGRTLVNIAGAIPDGMLVFFPSYGAMNYSIQYWKTHLGDGKWTKDPSVTIGGETLWQRLHSKKPIVEEPRNPEDFNKALAKHKDNVDSGKGGCLLAVCRGKVSEGLDFADSIGRAVIITGLPFPSLMEPKVKIKREYMDTMARTNKDSVNGDIWYSLQASRAVNQAIGRVIRHRNDFGCVLLCDERYKEPANQNRLSKWFRPFVENCASFGDARRGIASFFKEAFQQPFASKGAIPKEIIPSGSQRTRLLESKAVALAAPKMTDALASGRQAILDESIRKLIPMKTVMQPRETLISSVTPSIGASRAFQPLNGAKPSIHTVSNRPLSSFQQQPHAQQGLSSNLNQKRPLSAVTMQPQPPALSGPPNAPLPDSAAKKPRIDPITASAEAYLAELKQATGTDYAVVMRLLRELRAAITKEGAENIVRAIVTKVGTRVPKDSTLLDRLIEFLHTRYRPYYFKLLNKIRSSHDARPGDVLNSIKSELGEQGYHDIMEQIKKLRVCLQQLSGLDEKAKNTASPRQVMICSVCSKFDSSCREFLAIYKKHGESRLPGSLFRTFLF